MSNLFQDHLSSFQKTQQDFQQNSEQLKKLFTETPDDKAEQINQAIGGVALAHNSIVGAYETGHAMYNNVKSGRLLRGLVAEGQNKLNERIENLTQQGRDNLDDIKQSATKQGVDLQEKASNLGRNVVNDASGSVRDVVGDVAPKSSAWTSGGSTDWINELTERQQAKYGDRIRGLPEMWRDNIQESFNQGNKSTKSLGNLVRQGESLQPNPGSRPVQQQGIPQSQIQAEAEEDQKGWGFRPRPPQVGDEIEPAPQRSLGADVMGDAGTTQGQRLGHFSMDDSLPPIPGREALPNTSTVGEDMNLGVNEGEKVEGAVSKASKALQEGGEFSSEFPVVGTALEVIGGLTQLGTTLYGLFHHAPKPETSIDVSKVSPGQVAGNFQPYTPSASQGVQTA